MKAIVTLSGGMDSSTALAMAVKSYGPEEVGAVSFSYGQKHNVELEQALLVGAFFGIKRHEVIELPKIFGGAGSTLIEGGPDNPETTYEAMKQEDGPSPTVVPFRNANLISMATTIAIEMRAGWVYVGVHAEDARNWAYPDCTPEFIGAMANAVYVGSYGEVRLYAPFQYMNKGDIVTLGDTLRVPWRLTHSCYNGKRPACGKCPTCVERLAAFEYAHLVDPLDYEGGQVSLSV